MTKDEILTKLESLGIITEIGNEFFITEKYKEIQSSNSIELHPIEEPPKLDYNKILEPTGESAWPQEILNSKGRTRVVALMDKCAIPTVSKNDMKYRLRGIDTESISIINSVVQSNDIAPKVFIEAISLYYKYTSSPKAFKNLIKDGDILDLYTEHLNGELTKNLEGYSKGNSSISGTWS